MATAFVFETEEAFLQAVRDEVASMLGCNDAGTFDDKFRLFNINVPNGPSLSGAISADQSERGIGLGTGQTIRGDDGAHPSLNIDINTGVIQCRKVDATTLAVPPEE